MRVRILGTLLVAMGTVLATGCGSIGPSFDPLPLDGAPADQASEADGPIPSDSGTPDTPMDAFVGVDASADSTIDVLAESSADAGADSTVDTSLPSIDSAADSDDDSGDAVSTVPDSAPQDSATVADSAPSSGDSSDAPDTPASFTVGGTITGLAAGASLVLVDNGQDPITATTNGPFTFTTHLATGSGYAVTVRTQPSSPQQTCVVSAGAGTVAGSDVTGIVVDCTTGTYTVGGTVTGLAPGASFVLQDNGGDDLFVTTNGPFVFAAPLASGLAYKVTVLANPALPITQTCTVVMGSGTVGGMNVSNVGVTCITSAFTIGGTVAGLAAGDTVVLHDNGGDPLSVGANGAFTFATDVPSGATYAVTVPTNPSSPTPQVCTVTAGSGTVSSGDVTTVQVDCLSLFTVGGTVTGLAAGDNLVLQDNGADNLQLVANGSFIFPASLPNGQSYSVSVLTNPSSPAETCSVTAGSGTVASANVKSVAVTCAPAIITGKCSGACPCPAGATCTQYCQGGTCAFQCAAGATCQNACQGGTCTFDCSPGATCQNTCEGGSCTFTCEAGETCASACQGGACTFDCLPGSTCKNTCAGGDCAFDCDPTMSTCDDVCQGGICTGP